MGVTARLSQDTFSVSENCTVEVIVRSSEALAPGDTIEVQFPNSWYVRTGPSFTRELQTSDPGARHYLSAVTADGRPLAVETARRHLPFPEVAGRHGRLIVATVGEAGIPAGTAVTVTYANTTAPYIAEEETVFAAAGGLEADEFPAIKVRPGPAESVRLIAPSAARVGAPFEVLVVSLDRYENLSSSEFTGESLLMTDGTAVAEDLDFTGGTRVLVKIENPGIYRFTCLGAVSNAVRVGAHAQGPFWGDIHIHTKLSGDGQGTRPYEYARDVSGLDFAATADHWETLGEPGCEILLEWARRAHKPGRFVTILADERNPAALTGHHNLYFRDEETYLEHRCANRQNAADIDLESLDPERAMLIPHHTGIAWGALVRGDSGAAVRIDSQDRGLRPSIEIYSHHGQSEHYAPQHILSYEFNRMRNPERRANTSMPGPFYAEDWWKAGRRVGVIASSDEHSGRGGLRHGGIAAVWAAGLTREAVFDAIKARRSYATTGERILVDFTVAGEAMGGAVKAPEGEKAEIRLAVWGTDTLLRVEILRYRFGVDEDFHTVLSESPRPETTDAAYEIHDEIKCPCVYYARVVQEPLEWPAMAWTSPVWVEIA